MCTYSYTTRACTRRVIHILYLSERSKQNRRTQYPFFSHEYELHGSVVVHSNFHRRHPTRPAIWRHKVCMARKKKLMLCGRWHSTIKKKDSADGIGFGFLIEAQYLNSVRIINDTTASQFEWYDMIKLQVVIGSLTIEMTHKLEKYKKKDQSTNTDLRNQDSNYP